MACQTRQPRLMEIALNAIHYLVGKICVKYQHLCIYLRVNETLSEHGFLRGKRLVQHTPVSAGKAEDAEAVGGETKGPPPPSTLIDVIVETVSKCSDEADDGVQLQVCFGFAD